MKLNKLVLAVAVTSALTANVANATFLLPTSYDKEQDVKINKNASDITSLKAKDDVLDKKINDTYAYVNTKYTEAAGKNLERQVSDLQTNKVDKSVFAADQARQDKATSELNSKVDGYAAQGAAAYNELKGADAATNQRIDSAVSSQAERDAGQDEHINAVQNAAQTANDRVGQTETRLDTAEGAIRDVAGAAQTANDRVGATEVRLDGAEAGIAANADHINAVQDVASAADSRSQNNATRLDTVEGNVRETNAQLQVTDSRSINNAERLDGVEGGLRDTNAQVAANDKAINTRVDGVSNDLVNTNNRLDDNIKQTQTNTNDIVNVKATAEAGVALGQEGINRANNAQATADTAIKGVQSNSNRITNVETVQSQHSATLNDHENRITSNTSEIKKTQTVVNNHTDQLANHETRITNTETNVSNLSNEYYQFQDTYNYNNQVINQNMQAYSAQAVQQSKSYTDQQVGQLRNDWRQGRSDDQKEYRSGIASVAAMANIPVVPGQRLTVGAGIGQFKDRTALAVGVGANISPNVAAKASVGFSNDSDAVVGAGIGFGF